MAAVGNVVAYAFWPVLAALLVGKAVKPWKNTR